MSNSVRMLYKGVYRSDQSLSALIINITLVIPAQLSNYPLHFILIIYLRPHSYTIRK